MSYVPAMAVKTITLYENSSILYEEMIAQRIGLIPLSTDLKTYQIKDDKYKPGDARYECSLLLEKEGPGTVYSGDIKSSDPKIKPIYDNIPIVKLREGQKLKMEMTAGLGFITEHAKYQCAICSYGQKADDEFEFFVESFNNMSAREVLDKALLALEEKTKILEGSLTK